MPAKPVRLAEILKANGVSSFAERMRDGREAKRRRALTRSILESAPWWVAWEDFLDSRPQIRAADSVVQDMAISIFAAGWVARDELRRRGRPV